MDCRFFHGSLSPQDREFLRDRLRSYHAKLMLKSWVKLGKTTKQGGRGGIDPDKRRAAEILRRKGWCMKEHVDVYALDQSCVFWYSGER